MGLPASVTTTWLGAAAGKQPQAVVNEWVWTCAHKTFLTETQPWPTGSSLYWSVPNKPVGIKSDGWSESQSVTTSERTWPSFLPQTERLPPCSRSRPPTPPVPGSFSHRGQRPPHGRSALGGAPAVPVMIVGCAAPCGPSTAPFVSAHCVVVFLSFPAIYTAQTSCPRVSSVCASFCAVLRDPEVLPRCEQSYQSGPK